ncbi:hypothetical protein JMUB7514_27780 [Staphylococcus aureus]
MLWAVLGKHIGILSLIHISEPTRLRCISYAVFCLKKSYTQYMDCLLYTSDAADDSLRVDLGGRRIIKKKQEV